MAMVPELGFEIIGVGGGGRRRLYRRGVACRQKRKGGGGKDQWAKPDGGTEGRWRKKIIRLCNIQITQ
jgi:hypothetical protein